MVVLYNYTFSFEPKNSLLETANVIRKYSKTNPNQIIYDRSLEIEKDYEKNIFWTSPVDISNYRILIAHDESTFR